jgi:hypothetical protein
VGGLAGAAHGDGARQLCDLFDAGPGGRQVVVHSGGDLDAAYLNAPALIVGRAGLLVVSSRIGEIGGQIVIERALIGFDREHRVPMQSTDQRQERRLRVEGIGGVDASSHGQTRQQQLGHRDAHWSSRRGVLAARFLGCHGCKTRAGEGRAPRTVLP